MEEEHASVLERMQELEGWAEYIVEALHLNQRYEPVRREMLERILGERELRVIRELSWSLREKLHKVNTEMEFTRPLPQAKV